MVIQAERNVLPILNNLLENREMHLEDGRFLVSPARFDTLSRAHTPEELGKWRLVRVHDRCGWVGFAVFPIYSLCFAAYVGVFTDLCYINITHFTTLGTYCMDFAEPNRFRVIALGLPVPRYPGHPLDPPLR